MPNYRLARVNTIILSQLTIRAPCYLHQSICLAVRVEGMTLSEHLYFEDNPKPNPNPSQKIYIV